MPAVPGPAPEALEPVAAPQGRRVIVERPVVIEEDASAPALALTSASTPTPTSTSTSTPKAVANRAPKLTHEEMAALLAVDGALRPTPMARVWRRGRIIMVPTGLIGFAGHRFIGGWADVLAMVIAVAALLWCARPLLRRDAWS